MKPGRKQTPTALKVVRGNPGKRPLPKNEPKPARSTPKAPSYLSNEAKAHWGRVVKQLAAVGLMTDLDVDALAAYCEVFTRWVDANEKIRRHGAVVKSRNGFPTISPFVHVADKAFVQMRALLTEFGMTPSSRTCVTVAKREEDSPWARFRRN